VGEAAFGKIGRRLAQFSIYTTLAGVAIIFLILIGLLMLSIESRVSNGFWTLAIGLLVLTPIAMALKSYGELKIVRYG
jgi:hypothetical protein